MKSKSGLLAAGIIGLVLVIVIGGGIHLRNRSAAESDFLRGRAYQRGDGVPVDYAKAAELYKKAAAEGSGKAMHNLGYLYGQGWGVPRDPAESVKWFRMGAEHGMDRSQDMLGYIYLKGQGVPRDPPAAAHWFEKAADQGSLDGQLQLGLLYYLGDTGVPQDYSKAAKWLTLAAKQGSPAAENNLGVMCEDPSLKIGTQKQAVDWYTQAANAGYAKAQCNLGRIYFEGHLVSKDIVQGYMWLKLGADQNDVTANHLLADYIHGKGFTPEQIAQGNKLVEKFRSDHSAAPTLTAQNPPGH